MNDKYWIVKLSANVLLSAALEPCWDVRSMHADKNEMQLSDNQRWAQIHKDDPVTHYRYIKIKHNVIN